MIPALPLQWNPQLTHNTFFVSPSNEAAFHWIMRWPWPFDHLWIFGPQGCGKTHLATLWAKEHQALWITPWNQPWEVDRSSKDRCVIIEWDDVAAENMEQADLYAFLIRLQEMQMRCLWLSRSSAATWASVLADVNSRIHAMVRVEITAPDDILLAKVLEKSFSDFGWKVGSHMIDFLVRRMPRSFSGVAALTQLIHQNTHYSGLSIPLLKSILESMDPTEQNPLHPDNA